MNKAEVVADDAANPRVDESLPGDEEMSEVNPLLLRAWRKHMLAFALLLVATVAMFHASYWSMVTTWWRSETFAHGFIVVPISIYLAWRKRHLLVRIAPIARPWALLGIFVLGFFWLLGNAADVLGVEQLAVTGMIPLLVGLVFGWRTVRLLAFPLAFLFVAVPIGEFLVPYLVDFTASFTVHALKLTGVPVYWEGNRFSLPSGDWSVIKACSGVRYLYATLTVALLYVYLNYRSRWRQVLFVAISAIFAIFANGVRAYAIVMIGHLSQMRLAVGIDHFIYGWVFFALLMVILFWIGSFLREPEAGNTNERKPLLAGTPGSGGRLAIVGLAGIVTLGTFPAWAHLVEARPTQLPSMQLSAPSIGDGWQPTPNAKFTDWAPVYVNPTATMSEAYRRGDERAGLFVAYYGAQRQGSELINFQNVLATEKSAWHITGRRTMAIDLNGVTRHVRERRLRAGEGDLLVWQWYWVNGNHLDNPYTVKFHEALDKLTVGRRRGAGIVLYTPVIESVERARDRLLDFSVSAMPALDRTLLAADSTSN